MKNIMLLVLLSILLCGNGKCEREVKPEAPVVEKVSPTVFTFTVSDVCFVCLENDGCVNINAVKSFGKTYAGRISFRLSDRDDVTLREVEYEEVLKRIMQCGQQTNHLSGVY